MTFEPNGSQAGPAVAPDPLVGRGASIELAGVSQRFGRGAGARQALARVDLRIGAGEFVVLVGPSGCGKSTILNMIAGYLAPSTGRVLVGDRPVTAPGADRGMVFQQPRLFPWMSVLDNVAFGPRMAGAARADREATALASLELVGLTDVAPRAPYELSGGMQQRAAIARALAAHPHVLLMDEPFAALDALTRERLQEEIVAIWRRTGSTVVFVTHSVDEAVFVGTRVIVLSAHPGRVVFDEPVLFAGADRAGIRSAPQFLAMRDRVSAVVRGAAHAG